MKRKRFPLLFPLSDFDPIERARSCFDLIKSPFGTYKVTASEGFFHSLKEGRYLCEGKRLPECFPHRFYDVKNRIIKDDFGFAHYLWRIYEPFFRNFVPPFFSWSEFCKTYTAGIFFPENNNKVCEALNKKQYIPISHDIESDYFGNWNLSQINRIKWNCFVLYPGGRYEEYISLFFYGGYPDEYDNEEKYPVGETQEESGVIVDSWTYLIGGIYVLKWMKFLIIERIRVEQLREMIISKCKNIPICFHFYGNKKLYKYKSVETIEEDGNYPDPPLAFWRIGPGSPYYFKGEGVRYEPIFHPSLFGDLLISGAKEKRIVRRISFPPVSNMCNIIVSDYSENNQEIVDAFMNNIIHPKSKEK